MSDFCCTECFVNDTVKSFIGQNGATGDCEVCDAQGVMTIEARQLHDVFQGLVALYEPDQGDIGSWGGESLPECIEWGGGWIIFADHLDLEKRCRILDAARFAKMRPKDAMIEARSDGDWVASNGGPSAQNAEAIWQDFSKMIRHKRRFFLGLRGDNEWDIW